MSTRIFKRIDIDIAKLREEGRAERAALTRTVDELLARVAALEDSKDPDAAVVRDSRPARIPPRPELMKELGVGQDPE